MRGSRIKNIRKYLIDKSFCPRSIKYLGGGNHFNYKFESGGGEMFDVESEFKILKIIEKYSISPKPIILDKNGFGAPVLLESYVKGAPYSSFKILDSAKLKAALKLIAKTSQINISPKLFKFKYQNYSANIKNWRKRIEEIKKLGKKYKEIKKLTSALKILSGKAAKILTKNGKILLKTKPEFIYNDIHGDNLFWLPQKNKAVFIDWQKVSWGDPTFMLAVFTLAFESKVPESKDKFYTNILKEYKKIRNIKNLEALFNLRILEREISNMIWVPWHALKATGKLPFQSISDYSRLSRVEKVLKNCTI